MAIDRKGLVSTIDGGTSQRWSDMSNAEDILLEDAGICPLYYLLLNQRHAGTD